MVAAPPGSFAELIARAVLSGLRSPASRMLALDPPGGHADHGRGPAQAAPPPSRDLPVRRPQKRARLKDGLRSGTPPYRGPASQHVGPDHKSRVRTWVPSAMPSARSMRQAGYSSVKLYTSRRLRTADALAVVTWFMLCLCKSALAHAAHSSRSALYTLAEGVCPGSPPESGRLGRTVPTARSSQTGRAARPHAWLTTAPLPTVQLLDRGGPAWQLRGTARQPP